MKDDIDKTLEKIEADLQENTLETPLPKAAPTQYGINQRPQEMPHMLEDLPGLDTSTLVDHGARLSELRCNNRGYRIECQDCGFRFRSNDVDAYDLAVLHANRNQHRVSFKVDFFGVGYDLRIIPEKWQWRERLNRWVVCIGVPFLIGVGVQASYGVLSWWGVGAAYIGAWGGKKLYQLWRKRKEKADDES